MNPAGRREPLMPNYPAGLRITAESDCKKDLKPLSAAVKLMIAAGGR